MPVPLPRREKNQKAGQLRAVPPGIRTIVSAGRVTRCPESRTAPAVACGPPAPGVPGKDPAGAEPHRSPLYLSALREPSRAARGERGSRGPRDRNSLENRTLQAAAPASSCRTGAGRRAQPHDCAGAPPGAGQLLEAAQSRTGSYHENPKLIVRFSRLTRAQGPFAVQEVEQGFLRSCHMWLRSRLTVLSGRAN